MHGEVINNLLDNGNVVIFITSRGGEKFPGSEQVTFDYMRSHSVRYSKIIFDSHDKRNDCIINNIDIMIDDSIKNCELVSECGIKTIVYNTEINKDTKTSVERVNNWKELDEKIKKYSKSRVLKECNKEER